MTLTYVFLIGDILPLAIRIVLIYTCGILVHSLCWLSYTMTDAVLQLCGYRRDAIRTVEVLLTNGLHHSASDPDDQVFHLSWFCSKCVLLAFGIVLVLWPCWWRPAWCIYSSFRNDAAVFSSDTFVMTGYDIHLMIFVLLYSPLTFHLLSDHCCDEPCSNAQVTTPSMEYCLFQITAMTSTADDRCRPVAYCDPDAGIVLDAVGITVIVPDIPTDTFLFLPVTLLFDIADAVMMVLMLTVPALTAIAIPIPTSVLRPTVAVACIHCGKFVKPDDSLKPDVGGIPRRWFLPFAVLTRYAMLLLKQTAQPPHCWPMFTQYLFRYPCVTLFLLPRCVTIFKHAADYDIGVDGATPTVTTFHYCYRTRWLYSLNYRYTIAPQPATWHCALLLGGIAINDIRYYDYRTWQCSIDFVLLWRYSYGMKWYYHRVMSYSEAPRAGRTVMMISVDDVMPF